MKKIVIFLIAVISIICVIYYIYLTKLHENKVAIQENIKYESFENKEIEGIKIASLINRVIDENSRNNVQKDSNGMYIDNNKNSINIDIKFLDDDVIYNIEKIYINGIDKFVSYYGNIMFKCTSIQYHKDTNKVKYMLFEQTTQ